MNVQFHPPSGRLGNKGSCSYVAHYMDKEDLIRIQTGIQPELYFNQFSDEIFSGQVIKDIDSNKAKLCKDDAKFFFLSVSPSEKELIAMGITHEEQVESFKLYIKEEFIEQYAINFNKGLKAEDIKFYAKLHHKRKGDENSLHCHLIISRKDNANKIKLSPMTTHRSTTKGKVIGGFDRINFFKKVDESFDRHFNYIRGIQETFDYCYTMKNGASQQRDELIELNVINEILEIKDNQFSTTEKFDEIIPDLKKSNSFELSFALLSVQNLIDKVSQTIISLNQIPFLAADIMPQAPPEDDLEKSKRRKKQNRDTGMGR